MRRIAAVATLLFGLWVISLPFVFHLFDRTSAAEQVTTAFRSTLSPRGVAALEDNYATIRGLGTEFVGDLRPALAKRLDMTQPQFDQFVNTNFPAVGAAVKDVPPAIALVDPVVPRLARLTTSGDFAKVDAIPGLGLPIDVLPWVLLALGVVAAVIGLLGISGRRRWPAAAGLGLAAATVIALLAFNIPAKFDATARTVEVGRVALSQRAADTATQTVAVVDAMVTEVEGKLVPALATRFGQTPAQVNALIAANYPAVAKGLTDWPKIKPGAAELAANQRANVKAFAAGDGIPFRTFPWLLLGPALLLAAVCTGALALRQRSAATRTVDAPGVQAT